MGGRYQTIQVDFRACSDIVLDDRLAKEDVDAFGLISAPPASFTVSFSRFSATGVVELLRSRDAPGVRGVLAEDPKDANAPEPRPKAEEAPFVEGVTLVVVKGETPLNGLDLPLVDTSPPKRFADGYARGESVLLLSLVALLGLGVASESLVELWGYWSATWKSQDCTRFTLIGAARDCP